MKQLLNTQPRLARAVVAKHQFRFEHRQLIEQAPKRMAFCNRSRAVGNFPLKVCELFNEQASFTGMILDLLKKLPLEALERVIYNRMIQHSGLQSV